MKRTAVPLVLLLGTLTAILWPGPGPARRATARTAPSPRPPERSEGTPVPATPGVRLRVAGLDRGDALVARHDLSPPVPGSRRTLRYEVAAADRDTVATATGLAWERTVTVGPGVRQLEARVSLYAPMDLRLRALYGGQPDPESRVVGVRVGGREIEFRIAREPDGTMRLVGVPFVRGARLEVTLTDSNLTREQLRGRQVVVRRGTIERRAQFWTIALGEAEWETHRLPRVAAFAPMPARSGARERGRVRVTVVRRTGEPAAGVRVRYGRQTVTTGADGAALFAGIRTGRAAFLADAPGFVSSGWHVDVPEKGEASLRITEGEGRTVHVTVLDLRGRPVAGAEIVSRRDRYGLVRDGVQVVPILTDDEGRVALPHVGRTYASFSVVAPSGSSHVFRIRPGQDEIVVRLER